MEKTVKELYKASLALIATTVARAKSYDDFKLPIINQIISECFNANNVIRSAKGLEELSMDEMPYVRGDSDVIDYDIMLFRAVMPYGVASLLVADDDVSLASVYSNQYESKLRLLTSATSSMIEDVY